MANETDTKEKNWRGDEEPTKKERKASSLSEAEKLLKRDFLITAPSGVTYQIDMSNKQAYARLMSKMEGGTKESVSQFIVRNLVMLGEEIVPEIVLEPKIGNGGISMDFIPPSDINLILGVFIAGPSIVTGMSPEEEETFRK